MVGLVDTLLRNQQSHGDFSETKRRLGNMWDYLINQSDISKGVKGVGQSWVNAMDSPTIANNPTQEDVNNITNVGLGTLGASAPIPAEANAVRSFGGLFSKTYPDTATRIKAADLWKQGASPDEMLAATGLMPSLKGMLAGSNRKRFPGLLHYMADTNSELNINAVQAAKDYMNNTGKIPSSVKLADIIDKPDLYKAYPHFKDMPVEFNPHMDMSSFGMYNPIKKSITINSKLPYSDIFDTLNHELQHATAHIEGWPWGASYTKLMNGPDTRQFIQNQLTKSGSKMTVDDVYKNPILHSIFAKKIYPHAGDEVMARLAERTANLERMRKAHAAIHPGPVDPINMSDALMNTLIKIKKQYSDFNSKNIIYDTVPAQGLPKGVP